MYDTGTRQNKPVEYKYNITITASIITLNLQLKMAGILPEIHEADKGKRIQYY